MPCGGASDDALLARVAEGDDEAARALVERHLAGIVAFARRMLGSASDAEDVAQDTFVALWQQAARWQPGGARLATWLYKVAGNRCIDLLRRRREVGFEAAPEPLDPGMAAELHRRDIARLVEAALLQLPERQRLAVSLCHYQELGNIEAAAVMAISIEALESLLARGRRQLRRSLAKDLPDLLGEP